MCACLDIYSNPVWVCDSVCGLLPAGTSVCAAQQCHRDSPRRCKICHRNQASRCCEVQRHRYRFHMCSCPLCLPLCECDTKKNPIPKFLIKFFFFPFFYMNTRMPTHIDTHGLTHFFPPLCLFSCACYLQGFGTTSFVESANSLSSPM